jgi:hypothetical protein
MSSYEEFSDQKQVRNSRIGHIFFIDASEPVSGSRNLADILRCQVKDAKRYIRKFIDRKEKVPVQFPDGSTNRFLPSLVFDNRTAKTFNICRRYRQHWIETPEAVAVLDNAMAVRERELAALRCREDGGERERETTHIKEIVADFRNGGAR